MRFSNSKAKDAEINLAPLIDVVFILLVFFMVSTKFVSDNSFDVELPVAREGDATLNKIRLVVSISSKGDITINGESLGQLNKEKLGEALVSASNHSASDLVLSIKADGQADYQLVIDLMDTARTAGIQKVELATRKIHRD